MVLGRRDVNGVGFLSKASNIGVSTRTVQYITEQCIQFNALNAVRRNLPWKEFAGPLMVKESCAFQGIPGRAVYGFFRYGDDDLAIFPVLDDLINEGWELDWNEAESILLCMYTTSVFKQTQRQS